MDTFIKFFPLLITIWGIFTPGTGWIKELNEVRNRILDDKCTYSREHKMLLFHSDWKGFFFSFIAYQVLILLIILVITILMIINGEDHVMIFTYGMFSAIFLLRIVWNIRAFWFIDKPFIDKYFNRNIEDDTLGCDLGS